MMGETFGRRRKAAAALLVGALVLAATACGDDDDASSADTATASSAADTTARSAADTTAGSAADTTSSDSAPAGACAGEEGEAIKIGANVAASGGAANIGSEWQKGIELGVDAVNAAGLEVDGNCYHFDLDLQDNQTDAEQAIGINQRFLRDEIQYVFGPGVSSIFTPAYESLRGNDVMVFSPATTAAPLLGTEDGQYLFHTHIPDVGEHGRIRAMALAVVERYQPASVAILEPQDAAGDVHFDGFSEVFAEQGIDVVYSGRFDGTTTQDFLPYITAMKAESPDLVVVGYLDRWVEPFLAQSVQADFTTPAFVGSPGATFAAADGKTAIERYAISVTTRAVDDPADSVTASFRAAFEAKFGSAPTAGAFWALSYFDAVQMLAIAMSIAGSTDDLTAIAEALHSPEVTEYPGRTLDLQFTDVNDAQYTPQMGYLDAGTATYEDIEL